MTKRSLYQCFNARCHGERIVCAKGYRLGRKADSISLLKLQKGAPLEYSVCQDCPDYVEMGGPVSKKDRGWERKDREGRQGNSSAAKAGSLLRRLLWKTIS